MYVATTFYKGNMNMPIVQWDKQSTNLGLIGSCFTAAHPSAANINTANTITVTGSKGNNGCL